MSRFLNKNEEIFDASEHIIQTTFSNDRVESVLPSIQSTISHQERMKVKARDHRTKHNLKVMSTNREEVKKSEMNGVFLCSEEKYGNRCMCAFATERGR